MFYDFKQIELKWQKFWSSNNIYKVENKSPKPKYYILDMFPYPSGAGLHVGHPLGYIASDIVARYKRHKGFNVLHPQGFDSFGLPAEQYAIQTGKHPQKTTEVNIKRYKEQLDKMGFSFDWSREIRTSKPEYYKWTQWIFISLFESYYDLKKDKAMPITELIEKFKSQGTKNLNAFTNSDVIHFSSEEWNSFKSSKKNKILLDYRLAYISDTEVNWCKDLGTVLANDEIINGVSERGGYKVEKKIMRQWSMRITAYSERLLDGLNDLNWPDSLKEMQRNWIGKSKGASIKFKIKNFNYEIEIFTTRPDTLYGVTFMNLAPEHELILKITDKNKIKNIKKYINLVSTKSERERLADNQIASGIFTGAYAIHPLTSEELPIWISDYVLAGYGTGAVMAVPSGDERDFSFAKKHKIPIKNIFKNIDVSKSAYTQKDGFTLINSGILNDLKFEDAYIKIINHIETLGCGKETVNYKIRDAIFSRQRYWGEPIPIYYVNGLPRPIEKKYLPIELPTVDQYLPTAEGHPPLGNADNWAWDERRKKIVSIKLINNEYIFPMELNTMPGWAGSSWYFYRYMDPNNNEMFVGEEAVNYWKDVDLYIGGSEHATGHLLYSRFWQKFLFDLNILPVSEYARKLINQGMILGSSAFIYRKRGSDKYYSKNKIKKNHVEPIRVDISFVDDSDQLDYVALINNDKNFSKSKFILENGKFIVTREVEKMSKSKFNIVNPDKICNEYGADTLRMYEMFLGPIEQSKPWNTSGITGVHSFIKKFWNLFFSNDVFDVNYNNPSKKSIKVLHQAIKKIDNDINSLSFNTCISAFMICVNKLTNLNCKERSILEPLTILISPFAPHIAEELWSLLGNNNSIVDEKYPVHDDSLLVETEKNYPVSFNGKVKFTLELSLELSNEEIKSIVMNDERTILQLKNRIPKKIIIVSGKIINIVN
ncbi:MAG: leucine--tRNA ligase [Flavobacteriaceae bacterium]|nr:leucine--tRNA ligase [Flavobacteriaceae bacterium]